MPETYSVWCWNSLQNHEGKNSCVQMLNKKNQKNQTNQTKKLQESPLRGDSCVLCCLMKNTAQLDEPADLAVTLFTPPLFSVISHKDYYMTVRHCVTVPAGSFGNRICSDYFRDWFSSSKKRYLEGCSRWRWPPEGARSPQTAAELGLQKLLRSRHQLPNTPIALICAFSPKSTSDTRS